MAETEVRPATVIVVDRVIDAASNSFRVRLELPNPDNALPPGLRCKLEFEGMATAENAAGKPALGSAPSRDAATKPHRHRPGREGCRDQAGAGRAGAQARDQSLGGGCAVEVAASARSGIRQTGRVWVTND